MVTQNMPQIVIFEDAGYRDLLPLTWWRTVGELRLGARTLIDHLRTALGSDAGDPMFYCRPDLADVAAERLGGPVNQPVDAESVLFVNARLLTAESVTPGPIGSVSRIGDTPVIIHADRSLGAKLLPQTLLDPEALAGLLANSPTSSPPESAKLISYPWDLINANDEWIERDWQRQGKLYGVDGHVYRGVHILNASAVFIGKNSVIKPGVVIDAEAGPVLIGQDVKVFPNAVITGPCVIGDRCEISENACIAEGTTLGPRCKMGGEVSHSIVHGFSNKVHYGYLGKAYLGEWVNFGAGTTNSDLKNTYGTIRVPVNGVDVDTGKIFIGLTVGDFSKSGIGQMFSTGSIVGFGCNVATRRFAPRFVPSFTWLTDQGQAAYDVDRCIEVAGRAMSRRQRELTPAEEQRFCQLRALSDQIEQK